MDAIELRDVTKTFGQTVAVENLNLTIPQGGIYGFIGPNGAGKTTTIRLIMSILFPDSGVISVLGCPRRLKQKNGLDICLKNGAYIERCTLAHS